jgi:hypothetical protein
MGHSVHQFSGVAITSDTAGSDLLDGIGCSSAKWSNGTHDTEMTPSKRGTAVEGPTDVGTRASLEILPTLDWIEQCRCPIDGRSFLGQKNPRQGLWHHLQYYANRGRDDSEGIEGRHAKALASMQVDAGSKCISLMSEIFESNLLLTRCAVEPKPLKPEDEMTKHDRYRAKHPYKQQRASRLSTFRGDAKKRGIIEKEAIEVYVKDRELKWQQKHVEESQEVCSPGSARDYFPAFWVMILSDTWTRWIPWRFRAWTNVFQHDIGILDTTHD